jgi:hypothetical protein
MKLLLIESTRGQADAIRGDLVSEGHQVVGCAGDNGEPCRGVAQLDRCPLEGHIDLAIVTRTPGTTHTLAEMGGVCAERHRVPLIEVDPANVADEMPSVVVSTALATRAVEAAYATAVRHELADIPALVTAHRTPGRVRVDVQIPANLGDPARVAAVADRARHAVRTHDTFVRIIDVSVSCYPAAV